MTTIMLILAIILLTLGVLYASILGLAAGAILLITALFMLAKNRKPKPS